MKKKFCICHLVNIYKQQKSIYPQRPTYTARLFLKIVRAMCQEMYKKKYNDHVKTKYMQKYNYLITHFHANRRLVLIVLIAAITDTGSKR